MNQSAIKMNNKSLKCGTLHIFTFEGFHLSTFGCGNQNRNFYFTDLLEVNINEIVRQPIIPKDLLFPEQYKLHVGFAQRKNRFRKMNM